MSGKLLVIDMETKPAQAYVWGLFDQNISLSQLISPSAPICFSAKFVGEKEIFFHSDWTDGHDAMIKAAHTLISQSDAVITYNGNAFDLKKFRGEFVLAGLPPPPPVASIDLLKTVKKFGFQSGKLAYIGPFLRIGDKVKNEGFELWAKVGEGDPAAQKRMEKYCIGDIKLTEKLYSFVRPYIENHPYVSDGSAEACGVCGSEETQRRGTYRTKSFLAQRIFCNDCHSWSIGTRTKVKPITGEA